MPRPGQTARPSCNNVLQHIQLLKLLTAHRQLLLRISQQPPAAPSRWSPPFSNPGQANRHCHTSGCCNLPLANVHAPTTPMHAYSKYDSKAVGLTEVHHQLHTTPSSIHQHLVHQDHAERPSLYEVAADSLPPPSSATRVQVHQRCYQVR